MALLNKHMMKYTVQKGTRRQKLTNSQGKSNVQQQQKDHP